MTSESLLRERRAVCFGIMKPSVFCCSLLALSISSAEEEWQSLFNGRDLTGWSVTLDRGAAGEDPDSLVQVRDGAIHMYADTDPSVKVPFGVITHERTFSRFHLTLEYRWDEKKFAPRKDAIRDAGLLYHASSTDKVWPDSVECQIQEGDTGDLIFIGESGLSWAHPDPDRAPEGQGDAGLLPENGGFLRKGGSFTYFGRFPEHDDLTGWNRVEVIVHADESAEHIVNGHTRVRVADMQHLKGGALKEGKICLQLEGAEVLYRKIEVRELAEPLRANQRLVSLSAVKGTPSRSQTITITNPLDHAVSAGLSVIGKDASAFDVIGDTLTLGAGESMNVSVRFKPTHGAARYSAGLRVGSAEEGAFVILQGVGLQAFEGKNEPPLQLIVDAFGIPVNVGSRALELDTKDAVVGDGVAAPYFQKAGEGKVRITPLARFSPPGTTPFGMVVKGTTDLVELGNLADSETVADAHQSVLPPLSGEEPSVSFDAPEQGFAVYLHAHQYVSFTDPELPTEAKIAHTARVFPVTHFQGKAMENSWLIGFEEAANGDYQDALFLIENVQPQP